MKKANRPDSFRPVALGLIAGIVLSCSARAQESVQLPRDPFAAAAKLSANPSVADGHPVLVVDRERKPLAGVSVYVVDTKSLSRARRRAINLTAGKKYPGDIESRQMALLALHGKRYVTDARGEVRFGRISRGIVVAARGRTIAMTNVFLREGRDPRLIRLELKAKPGIDVLVVDQRGRPVRGVPVHLIWRSQWGSNSHGGQKSSGFDGRVRLSPLRSGFGSGDMVPYVEALVPAKERVAVRLDPKTFVNDPEKPVRVQLPPFGSVRVYVVDRDKRPVKGIEAVTMKALHSFDHRHETFRAPDVKDDYATFSFVEVGFAFEAWCRFKGKLRPQKVQDDGPRHASDMRVVTIEGVEAPVVVSFRLLDQKGAPVSRETVGVILTVPNSFQGRCVTTDADGRLEFAIDDRFADSEEGSLTITRRGRGRKLEYLGAARVELEQLAQRRAHGDLQLKDESLLVAGRVVDTAGNPVVGHSISVPAYYRNDTRGGGSTSGDPKFFAHVTQTDKDGRFEFRELDADPITIALKLNGYGRGRNNYSILEGGEADPGAKNHKVVVALTSTVSGSFKGLPKGARFRGQIEVQDENETPLANDLRLFVRLQAGGKFEIPSCAPGEYCLAFRLSSRRDPFLHVKGIKVESGKPCRDPRLQNIDLTKFCRNLKVTVLGPDRKPVPNTTVWIVETDKNGRGASGSSTGADGVIRLTVPLDGVNLSVVTGSGRFRAQHFAAQKDDLIVQMKPGWQVKLKIKNMPKLPDNLRIQVRTRSMEGPKKPEWGMGNSSMYSSTPLTGDNTHEMWSAVAGSMLITLYPAYAGDSNQWLNQRGPTAELKIHIKSKATGVQEFGLELDETGLETIAGFVEEAAVRSKRKKD